MNFSMRKTKFYYAAIKPMAAPIIEMVESERLHKRTITRNLPCDEYTHIFHNNIISYKTDERKFHKAKFNLNTKQILCETNKYYFSTEEYIPHLALITPSAAAVSLCLH